MMQGYGDDGIEPAGHASGGEPAGTGGGGSSSTWEIEEVASEEGASESKRGHPFVVGLGDQEQQGDGAGWGSCTGGDGGEDMYVAVGKGGSSMDALAWALNQLKPSASLYIVHVFPEVHHIPMPLANLPKGQVNPQQLETYMSQVRAKRRELLQKYLNVCHRSKAQVDTIVIESDSVAKSILELIPVLHIRKLIMGTSKANYLRMVRRGNGKAGQVLRDAPDYCEVKIICEGREVRAGGVDEAAYSSASPRDIKEADNGGGKYLGEGRNSGTTSCNCFSRRFM